MAMATSDFDIHYVAHLARVALTPREEELLSAQLGHILGYVRKLEELDVTGVEPTAHPISFVNVVRPDVARPSLPHEEAMRNAPAQANGLFVVPKIVE